MVLVGIVGSRTRGKDNLHTCGERVEEIFKILNKSEHVVVSGGCDSGADYWAKRLSNQYGFQYLEAVAFWQHRDGQRTIYDKTAGISRNKTIVTVCSKIYCVWDGKSPGTASVIEFCKKLGRNYEVLPL